MRVPIFLPLSGNNADGPAPANLAALGIWLDAFDVNAGAEPTNLDPIATWANKGTGVDALQPNPLFQPVFYASRINSHPALVFDAPSVLMEGATSPVALEAARHIFAVVTVPAANGTALYVPRAAITGAYAVKLGNSSGTVETNSVDTNNVLDNPPPAMGVNVIFEMSFSGVTTDNPVVTINGVLQPVSNGVGTGVGPETGTSGFQVGFNFGEAIGELLIYSGVQSAPDVAANRAYLSGKWGISV